MVITGLSGAGRSQAANILEDLGWFVIDNLPPALIPQGRPSWARPPAPAVAKIALVVGTGPYHADVLPALAALRHQGFRLRIAVPRGHAPTCSSAATRARAAATRWPTRTAPSPSRSRPSGSCSNR